uniref:EF-hand domain-containing protein n=1 Tax=Haptolina brevifila TaxID=156173 RepID=A0A7S2DPE4_9EUKA|mmetsp:Transcript_41898/g.84090  ORF Transcript_41898/g.84090 Transcript_41898/m.84090 type:complete len:110 (+) Transcript_41898:95-424(+)|eukprot:CAMPEP_0174737464 /NCGR_PEP_ID=MMETSP1094-20130205/68356_1 /TAXON_ID=156173 /ORGANISM="Chrysochromulina brevifilum, Strain UTEX LB 985" /LENGTH=109 /DNA_ID=CAMNT_0015940697 /DNA_START=80 /DNA_END=409 /DNA_ORIENTATION=+
MASDKERIRRAFTIFDTDGSGKLSTNELRAILSRGSNPMLSAAEVDEVIAEFAGDDGELSMDEFAAACYTLSDDEAAALQQKLDAVEEDKMLQNNPNGGNPFVMGGGGG